MTEGKQIMKLIDSIKSKIDTESRREIMTLAIPAMFETLCTTLTGMIDSSMVSKLGTDAISAISVTNQPKLFLFCFFLAINTVISSTVANCKGRGDRKEANSFFLTSLSFIVIGSIVIGLLAIVAARPILMLCSGQENTMDMSVTYFRIIMGGMIFNHLFLAINAELRGCGFTRSSLYTNLISCTVNILFNYLLIEGHLGFPALGIAGAAIATVLGTAAALVLSLYFLTRPDAFINLNYCRNNLELSDKKEVKGYVSMWGHVMIENVFSRLGFLISSALTARIGSFAMSIYAVGMHLMDLNYAIASGFQVAAVSKAGHLNGSGERDKINSYAVRILFFGLIFALALSALIIAFAEPYYSIFSSDEQFIQSGVTVCLIIAVISPIQIVKIIHTGLLQGLGKMRETKIAAILSVTIAQPICLFVLVNIAHMGLMGVWCSTLFSQLIWLITTRILYVKVKRNGFE